MNIYLNKTPTGWAWRISVVDSNGAAAWIESMVAAVSGHSATLDDAIGSAAIQLHNAHAHMLHIGAFDSGEYSERVFVRAEDKTERYSETRRAHVWVSSPAAMYGRGTKDEIAGAAERVAGALMAKIAE